MNNINKDLILRERLALQRTIMANQTTLLSFIRTSLYFLIAGLSINGLLKLDNSSVFQIIFFLISFLILVIGLFNYYKHKNSIRNNEKHIGDYQIEYLKK